MATIRLATRYTFRSLWRGGQRTVLALFCIAVGVMAVVSLRLAGDMITVSLTSNLREVLGGDISVQSNAVPLTRDQLAAFDRLKAQNQIQGYAALGTFNASVHRQGGADIQLQLFVVDDPAHYPLVDTSALQEPSGATESAVIAQNGSILLAGFAAEELSAHAGDSVDIGVARGGGGGTLKVGGIIAPRVTAGNPAQAYISRATYLSIGGGAGASQFGLVQVVVNGSSQDTEAVATSIRQSLPQTNTTTVKDALDQATQSSQDVNSALEVTGLLALLIGGVGVANTMQVSLRRRRVEVAMLKTAGYRRGQLISLFGLEAALLGLGGGLLGSLFGIGVADVVRILVQRAFFIDVPFSISTTTLASGLVVGLVTAIIFGLLPIVRSAAVRPVVVLRDDATPTLTSLWQSALLYGVLVVSFAALAASLLSSVLIAVIVVVVGLLLLGVLAAAFWLLVWAVGLIPVLERPRLPWAAFSVVALAAAVGLALWLGPIGWVLVVLAIANLSLVVMPRGVKTAAKLALRSLRRTRLRTATTLVALFSGVAAIGLILVLGQDVGNKLSTALESLSGYEVYTVTGPQDSQKLLDATQQLPGLTSRRVVSDIVVQPVSLDGRTTQSIAAERLAQDQAQAQAGGEPPEGLRFGALAGVEGYDLARGQVPDAGLIFPGKPLEKSDAGTNKVLVRTDLGRAPFRLTTGSTVVLTQPTSKKSVTVTVAGFYTQARVNASGVKIAIFLQPIIADSSVVNALAGTGGAPNPDLQTAVAVRLDPAQHDAAIQQLEHAVPRVYILDIAAFAETAQHILSNLVDLLIALASLSVVAGIVIIANTVALAMLERRREIGILKAVGHGRRSVLAQVIVENALVGVMGGVAGMLAVSLAARLLQDHVVPIALPVSTSIVLGCAGGLVFLVTLTATLVAWGPLRVRPVEVLRYE